jgi:hypothetical protein
LFIRVQMGIGAPQKRWFTSEAALGSDQGRRYLFVVNDENKVVYTPVEVGQRKLDGPARGLIAVEKWPKEIDEAALKKGAVRVLVNGLQRVRANVVVDPKLVPMPRAEAPAIATPVAPPKGGEGGSGPPKPSN